MSTEVQNVKFPHANGFEASLDDFEHHWKGWVGPGRPAHRLELEEVLPILNRKCSFDDLIEQNCDRGFDALCRLIVPRAYMNVMQASNEFFEINKKFFAITEVENPATRRMVRAVQLKGRAAPGAAATTESDATIVASETEVPIDQRFNLFVELSNDEEVWLGCDVRAYLRPIVSDPGLASEIELQLPVGNLNRAGVFALVKNLNVSTLNCCLAIIAWGGMRRDHARSFFACRSDWLGLADDLRCREFDRAEAYNHFVGLRRQRKLPGMGPAYFTKLLYFLSARSGRPGLIMDQWTARSANFLSGKNLVDLNDAGENAYAVSDLNTGATYEQFCAFLEYIAKKMNTTAELVELRMFSEGRGRGRWRNLIKQLT